MATFSSTSGVPFGFGNQGQTDKPYVSGSNSNLIVSTSLLDQRDIYKQLVDTQDDAEWLDFLWMAGKKEATSMPIYYNMYNDKLYNLIDTTGATIAGSGTSQVTITFPATGAGYTSFNFLLVNDLIKFPDNGITASGAIGKVSSKNTSTRVVVIDAVVTGAAGFMTAVAGNKLSCFSNAQPEGSNAPEQRRWLVNKLQNQTQIFRNTLKITDVQNMSKIELEFNGKPYILPYENIQALQKHRGDVSLALWLGQASTDTFQGVPFTQYNQAYATQTTRGMDSYISSYGINGQVATTGTFTLQDLSQNICLVTELR